MGMNKLLESKEKMEEINNNHNSSQNKVDKQKLSFEDRHKRMTTYVENDLYEEIQQMKKRGEIRTITEFVNEAFKAKMKNQ